MFPSTEQLRKDLTRDILLKPKIILYYLYYKCIVRVPIFEEPRIKLSALRLLKINNKSKKKKNHNSCISDTFMTL